MRVVRIREIAAPGKYSVVGGPFGSKLGTKDYVDYGIPVIRGANLPMDRRFDLADLVFVTEEKAQRDLFGNLAYPGDVVVTQRGTLGQVGLIPTDCGYDRLVVSQSQMKLTVDESLADRRFVYYALKSPVAQKELKDLAISSGVPHINLDIFRNFRIPMPCLETQRRAAGVLSAFDDLIENNRRRIEILEEMARLLYREWFVHFRFPGHQNVELVDSDLGPIPEGWEVTRTSDLIATGELEIGDGYRAKNAEMTGGPLRFLRVKNVQEGHFAALEEADSFPAEYTEVVGPKRSRIGDIAIAMKGSVGRLARVDESTPPLVYSPQTSYWRVSRPGRLSSTFLYEWMQGPSFVQQCAQVKGATDMADYVNLKDQRSMRLPLAPIELVRCFGDRVDPQLDLAANLRRQNAVLRETRDLLLPRLVSGELDVSELDLDGVLV